MPFVMRLKTQTHNVRVVQVACGNGFTIVVDTAGKVYSWGINGEGQLGVGDFETRHFPDMVRGFTAVRREGKGEDHLIAQVW